jgi:hypothetical protein
MALEIASLQELINAAIDMNERVIYDSSENIHFAIHNGVLYYFTNTISGCGAKNPNCSVH